MSHKHIIPTQRFGGITIECISSNVKNNYYMFNIKFEEFTETNIKLTLEMLEQILDSSNKIKNLIKESN